MRVLGFDIGVKNLAFCVMTENGVCNWNVLDIQGKDFNETSDNLISLLHDEFPELEYDAILIENQPVMKNPVMKTIQMMIFSYFKILAYQSGSSCDIKLVSAATKLKVKKNACKDTKLSYKEKKRLAVKVAGEYLRGTEWLEKLQAHTKKDDISDALLYCINFLEKQGVWKA